MSETSSETPNDTTTPAGDGFQPAAKLSGLKLNRPKYVSIDGAHVVVALVNGQTADAPNEVVAFTALCPHQMGDLSGGILEDGGIDCPLHFYRYDVRSGQCLYPRDQTMPLKTYPVRVDGDEILIKVERRKWMD